MTDDQFVTRAMYTAMVAERDALAARVRELETDSAELQIEEALHNDTKAEVARLTAQLAAAHGLQARAERAEAALAEAVAAERKRCLAIAEGWLAIFGRVEIEYVPARKYASDAVTDIAAAIRNGVGAPAARAAVPS